MAHWPMDELDRAQRLVSLLEAPLTIGVSEFESDAEADKARLDWIGRAAIYWDSRERHTMSVRECIDTYRNATKPTFTPIETDTKPK